MQDKDLTELLDAIVWAYRIVKIENTTYLFRPLSLEERNIANYIYSTSYEDALKSGMKSRSMLVKEAIKKDLWKASSENDVRLLREELAKLLDEMEKEKNATKARKTASSKLIKITQRVEYVTKLVREFEEAHTRYIELPSAEHKAETDRGIYFMHCATMTFPNKKQVWETLDHLKNEVNTILVGQLMHEFYKGSVAEESDVRRLARSGYWRVKWMGSKKNRGVKTLFDREMFDLTFDQFRLVYWSQIYDSAFESMEPPSDSIVEDDKKFDRWLDEQQDKRKKGQNKSDLDKKLSNRGADGQEVGFSAVGFYSEDCTCGIKEESQTRKYDKRGHIHSPSCPHGVFIYYNEATKQEKVQKIQSANPEHVRRLLGKEQARLAKIGEPVEEQVLRSDDKVRTTLGMSTKYHGSDKNKGNAKPR